MKNNPFNYGMPVTGKQFVGRSEQIEEAIDDLTNPGGHSLALIGGRRFGKTSFLEALQATLIEQLQQTQLGESYVFPVLVSLKSLEQHSPGGVFALMLRTFYDYFHSPLLRHDLGITLEFDTHQTQLATFVQSSEQACSFGRFSSIIEELLNIFINTYGPLRPVFLLDEIEKILDENWTEHIFGNLRSLMYTDKLRNYIRCVMAGSSKIIEVREKGSPLLNMLKVVYLEALRDKHIREIIAKASDVPTEIADAVVQECGGQPFLAQYIMHYWWDSQRKGTAIAIPTIVNRFRSEGHGDLAQWRDELGEVGLIAYKVLMEADTWFTETEIKQQVHDEHIEPHIGPALINLCYHGLVRHDGTWSKYRVAGKLFKDWFIDEILPTLQSHTSSPSNPPTMPLGHSEPIVHVSLYTNIFPTAYCHAITVDTFPFVRCTIDNTNPHCTNAKVTIEATIQGFSEASTDTLDIPSGQVEQSVLLPILNREKALSLTEICPAKCRVVVRRHNANGSSVLYDKTHDVQLQAFDTALLARLNEQSEWEDLANYLAVFVTPKRIEIQTLVGIAVAQYHPDKAMPGYRGTILDEAGNVNHQKARDISSKQVKAFYNTLKHDAKLHYTNSTINFGKQSGYVTQRVRFPFESLAAQIGQSNCIDGAVLLASLLEHVGMEPLIVLIKGHAFVGWRIWKGIDEYDFLETTMIHSHNFEAALAEGNRKHAEAKQRGDNLRAFLDAQGFMRIVDITYCRSRGIYALT